MKVIPLGTSACVQNPGNACSGYFVESGGTGVLMDCGPGVIGNLRHHVEFCDLDAIVISHMHQDHFLDLIPLRCGLKFLGPIRGREVARVPLYLPPGGAAILNGVFQCLPMSPEDQGPAGPMGSAEEVFVLEEFSPDETFAVGGLQLRTTTVVHDVPAWGLTIEGPRRLAYSGDSGPCPAIETVAAGADLFVCEVGSPDSTELDAELGGGRVHLAAAEAAEIARRAGVGRLLLTHTWHEYNVEQRLRDAKAVFGENVAFAAVNEAYDV